MFNSFSIGIDEDDCRCDIFHLTLWMGISLNKQNKILLTPSIIAIYKYYGLMEALGILCPCLAKGFKDWLNYAMKCENCVLCTCPSSCNCCCLLAAGTVYRLVEDNNSN